MSATLRILYSAIKHFVKIAIFMNRDNKQFMGLCLYDYIYHMGTPLPLPRVIGDIVQSAMQDIAFRKMYRQRYLLFLKLCFCYYLILFNPEAIDFISFIIKL